MESKEIFTEAESSENEYKPKDKYEKALYGIYKNETSCEILKISSYAIVVFAIYVFFMRLMSLVEENPTKILWVLIVTGIPFVAVSILRKIVNAPRPYEIFEFYKTNPKDKKGESFPSRHVFSIFIIGVVIMSWNVMLGILLLVLGVVLSVLRVLLGIHFIRDVIAGAAIGTLSGIIGLIVLHCA